MGAFPLQDLSGRKATLPLVLKAIRRQRGLRSSEVARAMGMPLRSYEPHLKHDAAAARGY